MPPEGPDSSARLASDVMAFGQEVGRVLSDGRIVGRAEPYAKVFASSRAVKRAVGVTAWAVLEDIALDARLDDRGRLVAETNVRRIASNLGLGKNAVSRHLSKLREFGFVLHEEMRDVGSGRYQVSRYVLDPSACIERFTHTPPATRPSPARVASRTSDSTSGATAPESDEDCAPRPFARDAGRGALSPLPGHRDRGQKSKRTALEDHRQQAPEATETRELLRRLVELGIGVAVAEALIVEHPGDVIEGALYAATKRAGRSPAGFVVAALRQGWDLADETAHVQRTRAARSREQQEAAAESAAREEAEVQRAHSAGWAAVLSDALSDAQLRQAASGLTGPLPGLGRRSLPVVRAHLVAWAAAVAEGSAPVEIAGRLQQALRVGPVGCGADPAARLPEPPVVDRPTECLSVRLQRCLPELDFPVSGRTKGLER